MKFGLSFLLFFWLNAAIWIRSCLAGVVLLFNVLDEQPNR
jgi:hypothetical protein